jgi:hypothetical protein
VDYFSNRAVPGRFFATEVYDVVLNPLPARVGSGATVGGAANMRFVQHGRPPPPPI